MQDGKKPQKPLHSMHRARLQMLPLNLCYPFVIGSVFQCGSGCSPVPLEELVQAWTSCSSSFSEAVRPLDQSLSWFSLL